MAVTYVFNGMWSVACAAAPSALHAYGEWPCESSRTGCQFPSALLDLGRSVMGLGGASKVAPHWFYVPVLYVAARTAVSSVCTTTAACATASGADCCIVFEVENGRITSGREHFYDLHNWDQFWP